MKSINNPPSLISPVTFHINERLFYSIRTVQSKWRRKIPVTTKTIITLNSPQKFISHLFSLIITNTRNVTNNMEQQYVYLNLRNTSSWDVLSNLIKGGHSGIANVLHVSRILTYARLIGNWVFLCENAWQTVAPRRKEDLILG